MIKEAYLNLIDIWKKDTLKQNTFFQVYVALMFRFSKMNNPIIDQDKLKQMFNKLATKVEEDRFELFNALSAPGIIAFLELCQTYEAKINENFAGSRAEYTFSKRR